MDEFILAQKQQQNHCLASKGDSQLIMCSKPSETTVKVNWDISEY